VKRFAALGVSLCLALFLLGAAMGGWRLCVRVVDGDTLLLEGGERVRLLGVDAPELAREGRAGEAGAKEAKEFLRRLAEGRRVRLELDGEPKDKYGRTLAYVFTEEGEMANEELIRAGLAEPIRFFPYRLKARFFALARERQKAKPSAP